MKRRRLPTTEEHLEEVVSAEEYEDLKFLYQRDLREYKRKEKQALETFPKENKRVFPALISCISDASIQDLKRSPEGSALYHNHDAYGLFKLAILEHDYLPPSMSSAALSRAKTDFESLQQKSEDSLTEHINEFRRRPENLIKIRGPDGGSPYMDFDLRDLLLRSLYKPLWGPWIASRKSNANLPVTFENLILALTQAESDMILEGTSVFDSYMPSAHSTNTTPLDTTSSSMLSTGTCQCCGATFQPKRPTHIRCDKCQHEFSSKRKADRKKSKQVSTSKTKQKKSRSPPTKPFAKKVHSTTTALDSDDSSSDCSEDDSYGAHFTSFCCTQANHTTSVTSEPLIYFDNCSNINVIRDAPLALDVRQEKTPTKITGSIPGKLHATLSAALGDLGRGVFNSEFSRNLLSEDAAIRAGYRVIRDSNTNHCYQLIKANRPPLVFELNHEGTFSIPVSTFMAHFKDLYATSHSTDVNRHDIIFTKRQRERAAIYHHDHQNCLGHAHPDRIIAALRAGLLINAPYTEADVRNAQIIYGSCPTCSRTKGTRHQHTGTYPELPSTPGEYLAGDLFTIMGILFSLITCRLIKLRCITRLSNKSASEVSRAIRETVDVWRGYGAKPRVLSWDQKPALVHRASEIWSQHGLRLDFTSPDSHERVAERDVRTIKEHVYASILDLPHAVDAEMVEGIVRDTVVLLNFLPNSETPGASPHTILDGERLNYASWSRVYAGQVAEFEIPYVENHKRGTRREIGYVIGHQGDNPIVRLLPHGKRLVIRSGHIKPIEKSSAIIRLIEQGITGAKRQRYNDLLAEIQDFYGNPPTILTAESDPMPYSAPQEFNFLAQPPPVSPPSEVAPDLNFLAQAPPEPQDTPSLTNTPEHLSSEGREIESSIPDPPSSSPLLSPSHTPTPPVSPRRRQSRADTPIPRRTTRSHASKPPGFYKKLHSGDSVADYTACHLRAAECERLYGAEMTTEAGETEVVNIITTRKCALPQDYRKLSRRAIREAIPSFMFYKAKDETPEPMPVLLNQIEQPVKGWTTVLSKKFKKKSKRKIRLRGRWVGGGHRQKRSPILQERNAPTARTATHSLLLAIASKEGRKLQVGDIPSAYLQAEHKPANGQPVHIIADKHTTAIIIKTHPEYKDFALPNGTMILRVDKAMYGLVESAWLWYKELEKHLTSIGYTVSVSDRALFYKKTFKNGVCIASNIASVHVDDIASAATPNDEGLALENEFWDSMEKKWPGIKRQSGPFYRHLYWNLHQDPKTMKITSSLRDLSSRS